MPVPTTPGTPVAKVQRTTRSRGARRLLAALAGLSLAAGAGACGGDGADQAGGAEPEVTIVGGTTHVADLARNVGGERAEVVALLAANTDPHDYEPRPGDVQAVAEADLVLQSGGDVDLWLDRVVEGSGTDAPVVSLIDSVATIRGGHAEGEDEGGAHGDAHGRVDEAEPEQAGEDALPGTGMDGGEDIDPHWWHHPGNAVRAVERIRDELSAVDPAGAAVYEENAASYVARLERLDAAMAECIEQVPVRERKLVTSHDALGYLADRYEIEVVGAAIPALTTQAQPSAGEVSELVELIRTEGVRAVFTEAGMADHVQQALAAETDAEVGGVLWADTLGPEGSGAETYVQASAANAQTLVRGFSGGRHECEFPAGLEPG